MDLEKTANIIVPPEFNLAFIAESAGNADLDSRLYHEGRLYVSGVTQKALDDALAAYDDEANGLAEYIPARRREYPSDGDQLDAAFKQRQKAKMLVGQARAKMEAMDLVGAISILLEAIEPPEDSHETDAKILAVKKKYPKN